MVAGLEGFDDTMVEVILQYELAGVVDCRLDRGELHEHLGAIAPLLDHALDCLEVTDRARQSVMTAVVFSW